MKILLLGANGQVGWELRRSLAPLGEIFAPTRAEGADLSDPPGLLPLVDRIRPDVIANAAAYTAVDRAESETDLARRVNADAPAVLARAAAGSGAWLVHYSTDYVFDGAKPAPYGEGDAPNPLNVYGATKLAGERAVLESGCRCLVFRVSWIYAARGINFIRAILRQAREKDSLRVVADQRGAPTGAELVADATAIALRCVLAPGGEAKGGLYHLAAAGETTWHAYARLILAEARAQGTPLKAGPDAVAAVSTAGYPTPARRPANSRLDTARLRETFGICPPPWQGALRRTLAEILAGPCG